MDYRKLRTTQYNRLLLRNWCGWLKDFESANMPLLFASLADKIKPNFNSLWDTVGELQ
jgi:hypothetical protein